MPSLFGLVVLLWLGAVSAIDDDGEKHLTSAPTLTTPTMQAPTLAPITPPPTAQLYPGRTPVYNINPIQSRAMNVPLLAVAITGAPTSTLTSPTFAQADDSTVAVIDSVNDVNRGIPPSFDIFSSPTISPEVATDSLDMIAVVREELRTPQLGFSPSPAPLMFIPPTSAPSSDAIPTPVDAMPASDNATDYEASDQLAGGNSTADASKPVSASDNATDYAASDQLAEDNATADASTPVPAPDNATNYEASDQPEGGNSTSDVSTPLPASDNATNATDYAAPDQLSEGNSTANASAPGFMSDNATDYAAMDEPEGGNYADVALDESSNDSVDLVTNETVVEDFAGESVVQTEDSNKTVYMVKNMGARPSVITVDALTDGTNDTTSVPSDSPTDDAYISNTPSVTPTLSPAVHTMRPTAAPTKLPSRSPSSVPTFSPTTIAPSLSPSRSPTTRSPTSAPSSNPSRSPVTVRPSLAPTSAAPTGAPTPMAISLTKRVRAVLFMAKSDSTKIIIKNSFPGDVANALGISASRVVILDISDDAMVHFELFDAGDASEVGVDSTSPEALWRQLETMANSQEERLMAGTVTKALASLESVQTCVYFGGRTTSPHCAVEVPVEPIPANSKLVVQEVSIPAAAVVAPLRVADIPAPLPAKRSGASPALLFFVGLFFGVLLTLLVIYCILRLRRRKLANALKVKGTKRGSPRELPGVFTSLPPPSSFVDEARYMTSDDEKPPTTRRHKSAPGHKSASSLEKSRSYAKSARATTPRDDEVDMSNVQLEVDNLRRPGPLALGPYRDTGFRLPTNAHQLPMGTSPHSSPRGAPLITSPNTITEASPAQAPPPPLIRRDSYLPGDKVLRNTAAPSPASGRRGSGDKRDFPRNPTLPSPSSNRRAPDPPTARRGSYTPAPKDQAPSRQMLRAAQSTSNLYGV